MTFPSTLALVHLTTMMLLLFAGCVSGGRGRCGRDGTIDRRSANIGKHAGVAVSNTVLADRLLEVVEQDVVPLTQAGVRSGSKVFGAAILRKSDLSVVVASTNAEIENPLWHGEVHTIKKLYEMPRSQRPAPKDCIFLTTHEPCPLCVSAITWGGYDNFYYLFSYEDSRDAFNIPHDIRIMREVFNPDGYARKNVYWTNYDIMDLINASDEDARQGLLGRVTKLKEVYAAMSEIYQQNKGDSDIPLK